LVTFSTILALAAFLNQSTILNARMQSTEKNHNWRNFENFKNIVGKCYVLNAHSNSSLKYFFSAIKAKISNGVSSSSVS